MIERRAPCPATGTALRYFASRIRCGMRFNESMDGAKSRRVAARLVYGCGVRDAINILSTRALRTRKTFDARTQGSVSRTFRSCAPDCAGLRAPLAAV